MEKGVQHNPTAQLTRIPAASARNNQVEAGRRTNIASGTGSGGRSIVRSRSGRRRASDRTVATTGGQLHRSIPDLVGSRDRYENTPGSTDFNPSETKIACDLRKMCGRHFLRSVTCRPLAGNTGHYLPESVDSRQTTRKGVVDTDICAQIRPRFT